MDILELVKEYLILFKEFLIKPTTVVDKNKERFTKTKESLLLASIVSGITTLITLIYAMYNEVYTPASAGVFGYGETEASIVMENLKNVEYFSVIFKTFFLVLFILLALSAIYYLAAIIIKKEVNYQRLLASSTLASVPVVITLLVLSPIAFKILPEFGMLISTLGVTYGIAILFNLFNKELNIKDENLKIIVNTVTTSVIILLLMYIAYRTAMGVVADTGLLDLLG